MTQTKQICCHASIEEYKKEKSETSKPNALLIESLDKLYAEILDLEKATHNYLAGYGIAKDKEKEIRREK